MRRRRREGNHHNRSCGAFLFRFLVRTIYLRRSATFGKLLLHVVKKKKSPKNAPLPKSNITMLELQWAEISCVLCEKNWHLDQLLFFFEASIFTGH